MIEYDYLHPVLIDMAARRPQKDSRQPKPKKKRRKMRLSLRQSKIKKTDSYTDSIGWSQTGRVLEDAPKAKEPETLTIQCDQCGSRLKIPKPKKLKDDPTRITKPKSKVIFVNKEGKQLGKISLNIIWNLDAPIISAALIYPSVLIDRVIL